MRLRTVKDFAVMVRAHRRARGWSQQQLADSLGVNRDWVTNFERGKTTVQFGLVLRAIRELGIILEVPSVTMPSGEEHYLLPDDDDWDIVNLNDLLNEPPGDPPVFTKSKDHE